MRYVFSVLDTDPKWMYSVRLKQMIAQKSQPTTAAHTAFTSSDARTLPQFLSAHERHVSSYAAAVRRSPNRVNSSHWADSRSSSPTASLSAKLSTLYLGSKGSSPSSTTSESTSDRERPLSAGAVHNYRRNSNTGNTFTVGGVQGWGHTESSGRGGHAHNKGGKTPRHPWRPPSNNYSARPQSRTPSIPGLLSVTQNASEEKEGGQSSDGGWIKVERHKRLPRQDNKQVRGRPRRGGRGGRGGGGRT